VVIDCRFNGFATLAVARRGIDGNIHPRNRAKWEAIEGDFHVTLHESEW
jgi:hypothetical protein